MGVDSGRRFFQSPKVVSFLIVGSLSLGSVIGFFFSDWVQGFDEVIAAKDSQIEDLRVEISSLEKEGVRSTERNLELKKRLFHQEETFVKFSEDLREAQEPQWNPDDSVLFSRPQLYLEMLPKKIQDFISRFNRTLGEDRVREWRLFESGEVGNGVISRVVLHRVGARGAISGAVVAESMRLALPPVPNTIWLLLQDGYEFNGGEKRPFLEEGYRIELSPVDISHWQKALPELFAGDHGAPLSQGGVFPSGGGPTNVLENLNGLMEGYRFSHIGSLGPGVMRNVTIDQVNKEGEVVQVFRAAIARLRFDYERNTVELILVEGSQEKEGVEYPLPKVGYRLFFPHIPPQDWIQACGPSPRR